MKNDPYLFDNNKTSEIGHMNVNMPLIISIWKLFYNIQNYGMKNIILTILLAIV